MNNGKYDYFLTYGKKNYKIPEWLNSDEVILDLAKRLINEDIIKQEALKAKKQIKTISLPPSQSTRSNDKILFKR